ncbi:hypothetical protein QBC43DRAFT_352607 [Cladorrhinum sp. PSN259]|nr:hypothetical protein QBC43DRAFT_352607 [Cladorrhinum sp. PSN259]
MATQLGSSRFNRGPYNHYRDHRDHRSVHGSYPNLNRWLIDQANRHQTREFYEVKEYPPLTPVITIDDDEGRYRGPNPSSAAVLAPVPMRLPDYSVPRESRNKRKANVMDEKDEVEDVIFVRQLPQALPARSKFWRTHEIVDLTLDDDETPSQDASNRDRLRFGRIHQDEDVMMIDPIAEDALRASLDAMLGQPGPSARKRPRQIVVAEAEAEPEPLKLCPLLEKLPLEIREKIYRHLLVAPKPIPVKNLWSEAVHVRTRRARGRRGQPEEPDMDFVMEPRILFSCRQAFAEGTKVLYSENTFFYQLRDPNIIPRLNNFANNNVDARNPAFYRGRTAKAKKEAERAKAKKEVERAKIHLDKYGHLIRHMSMELEHNRTSDEYRDLMIMALNALVNRPPSSDLPPIYLHTLTITISPTYERGGRDSRPISTINPQTGQIQISSHRGLNTVNIFAQNSALSQALHKVNLDFLRINVHVNSHLSPFSQIAANDVLDEDESVASDIEDPQTDSDDDNGNDNDDDDDDDDDDAIIINPTTTAANTTANGGAATTTIRRQKRRRYHLETTIDLRHIPAHISDTLPPGPSNIPSLAPDVPYQSLLWKNDTLMHARRLESGRKAQEALASLKTHIEEACTIPEHVLGEKFWEDHETAEHKRKEKKEREEKKFCGDAYDTDDDDGDDDDDDEQQAEEESEYESDGGEDVGEDGGEKNKQKKKAKKFKTLIVTFDLKRGRVYRI